MNARGLPIHRFTTFVLVQPHYPENVGAAARAMKTQGFGRLALVKPSRLAGPDHPMARKMAVKSCDVLEQARIGDTLEAVLDAGTAVATTTSRRGVSGILGLRAGALELERLAASGKPLAIVLGNEKTGLSREELWRADYRIRIPMVADQPSVNLAQAVQLIAYELFMAALAARDAARPARESTPLALPELARAASSEPPFARELDRK